MIEIAVIHIADELPLLPIVPHGAADVAAENGCDQRQERNERLF